MLSLPFSFKAVGGGGGLSSGGVDQSASGVGASTANEAARLAELERHRQEEQRRQIQDALNIQTFSQFRAYAEQQYPSNPDQQAVLIRYGLVCRTVTKYYDL